MKTIEFELDYTLPETGYYCTCCKHTEIDHSGTYVLASEAQALEELLKEAEYILRHDKYTRFADSICAALEVKP
jgi:hypothetical protein